MLGNTNAKAVLGGGALFDIKTMAEAVADKGWAFICKSTRQDLAKADVPTLYEDIKNKYDNVEEQLSSLITGQSLTNQGGCAYSNGYYFIVKDNKMYYSASVNGTYTLLDDYDTSGNSYSYANIFAGDNILVCSVSTDSGDKIRIIDTHNFNNKKNITNVSGFEGVKRVFKVGTTLYIFTPYNTRKIYSISDSYSATSVSTAKTFNYDVYDIYEDNGSFYQLAGDSTIRKSTSITGTYSTIYTDPEEIYADSFIAVKDNFICWLSGRNFPIKYTTNNFTSISQTSANEDIGFSSAMLFLPFIFQGNLYYKDEDNNKVAIRALNSFNTKSYLTASQNNGCSVVVTNKSIVFVTDKIYYREMQKISNVDTYEIGGNTVTITYYAKDGFKICLADNTNDTNLATVYSYLGYYNYYRLDTTNETISLPRNSNLYSMMYVGDNYQDTLTGISGNTTRLLPQAEVISDSSATPTLEIEGNKTYQLTNSAITSITISSCEDSPLVTKIDFTTGATAPTLTDSSSGIDWADGQAPVFQSYQHYWIIISDKVGFVKEIY